MTHDAIVISCEPIDQPLLAELAELYALEPYKQPIWNWQFKSRLGRKCLAIIARHDGRLIGFNATMPVNIVSAGMIVEGIWSCDFIVAKDYRGKGVGNAIKAEMLATFKLPIMSLGISDDALPILIKKGWQHGPLVPVMKRSFRARNLRELVLSAVSRLRASFAGAINPPGKYGHRFYPQNTLPNDGVINQLIGHQFNAQNLTIYKDYDYLSWRYTEFPWPAYTALLITNALDIPLGLLIYRMLPSEDLEITDYIGDIRKAEVIAEAIGLLCYRHPCIVSLTWTCSSLHLQQHLQTCGLLKKRYGTRFVCYDSARVLASNNWSLAAGDSDGDFLKEAKAKHESLYDPISQFPSRFQIVRLDEQSLFAAQQEWDSLVKVSNANPLFMSWSWQTQWWKTWGNRLGLELFVHFIYSGNELVGILPLYLYKRPSLGGRDLQFIGNAWRIAPSIRSEYISPIFLPSHQSSLLDHLERWLSSFSWRTTLIIPDCVIDDKWNFSRAIIRQSDRGYRVNTEGDKEVYIARLGAQTRLKAFNRLGYLDSQYKNVQWETCDLTADKVDQFFENLNGFHLVRWSKPCFDEHAISFHKSIIFGENDIKPVLHCLRVNGELVSLSYNLVCGDVMYNIQSGYQEGFDKKLSLGTLHFGKLLAICFEDKKINKLDFLAGSGKKTDYKNHFGGERVNFLTLQLFSSAINRRIYAMRQPAKYWLHQFMKQ